MITQLRLILREYLKPIITTLALSLLGFGGYEINEILEELNDNAYYCRVYFEGTYNNTKQILETTEAIHNEVKSVVFKVNKTANEIEDLTSNINKNLNRFSLNFR